MKKSKKTVSIPECFKADLDIFSAILDAIIAEAKPVLPWARVADLEQAKLGIAALREHRKENS
jgi:hypothetical protein